MSKHKNTIQRIATRSAVRKGRDRRGILLLVVLSLLVLFLMGRHLIHYLQQRLSSC